MKIYDSILDTVGNTPLIALSRVTAGLEGQVVVKHEAFNPGGSVKDRIALTMIEEAERSGALKPGGTIIENTSGNTGLGLAIAACVKGYRAIMTMPDKVASEKSKLLKAFGAEPILCPTAVEPKDPRSYYSVAARLAEEIDGSFFPNQYDNAMNPEAHYQTTGPEIWRDTDGKVTHFVAGMGTGGTITGCARYFKEQNEDVKIIGIDPVGSLYTEYFETRKLGATHTYKVEGIGEDFLPTTIDFDLIDQCIQVGDMESYSMARRLTREEGIFSGSSGGCAVAGALIAARALKKGDLMVVIIPDTGERYLSKVYDEDWLRRNQLLESGIDLNVGEILARKQGEIRELISVQTDTTVRETINVLCDKDISQVPVMDGRNLVGSVREAQVMHLLLGGDTQLDGPVREIMGKPFPVVEEHTSAGEVVELFSKGVPAVLVVGADTSEPRILTKWDVLQTVRTKR